MLMKHVPFHCLAKCRVVTAWQGCVLRRQQLQGLLQQGLVMSERMAATAAFRGWHTVSLVQLHRLQLCAPQFPVRRWLAHARVLVMHPRTLSVAQLTMHCAIHVLLAWVDCAED